jgi:hypothetical protein
MLWSRPPSPWSQAAFDESTEVTVYFAPLQPGLVSGVLVVAQNWWLDPFDSSRRVADIGSSFRWLKCDR